MIKCVMFMVAVVSRIECMLSCGVPMSTVVTASLLDTSGPIVVPHGHPFFTM